MIHELFNNGRAEFLRFFFPTEMRVFYTVCAPCMKNAGSRRGFVCVQSNEYTNAYSLVQSVVGLCEVHTPSGDACRVGVCVFLTKIIYRF